MLFGPLWQWQRSLAEGIAPSLRCADICVAEPKDPLERVPVIGAFAPQFCSYDRRGTPNTHFLLRFLLVFVSDPLASGFIEQIRLCAYGPVSAHQNEIVSKDAIHRSRVVGFDGCLVPSVQVGNRFLVICACTASTRCNQNQACDYREANSFHHNLCLVWGSEGR